MRDGRVREGGFEVSKREPCIAVVIELTEQRRDAALPPRRDDRFRMFDDCTERYPLLAFADVLPHELDADARRFSHRRAERTQFILFLFNFLKVLKIKPKHGGVSQPPG
jgi:hypothetical protein